MLCPSIIPVMMTISLSVRLDIGGPMQMRVLGEGISPSKIRVKKCTNESMSILLGICQHGCPPSKALSFLKNMVGFEDQTRQVTDG